MKGTKVTKQIANIVKFIDSWVVCMYNQQAFSLKECAGPKMVSSFALLQVHSMLGDELGLQEVLGVGQLGLQVLDVADGVQYDIQVGFLAGIGHKAS